MKTIGSVPFRWSVVVPILTIVATGAIAQAYETPTHQAISERALIASSVHDVLRNALALEQGIDQVVAGATLLQWIRTGSLREDDHVSGTLLRFRYHFHNPLQPWDEAGLRYPEPYRGQQVATSSILWSQDPNQSWSWPKTRDHYREALTAKKKRDRDTALAKTFRGLGQVIHLIQDAASPAHTRNDPHAGYNYESLVLSVQSDEAAAFQRWLAVPVRPGDDWMWLRPHLLAPLPISRLIDTDRYERNNPWVSTEPPIGLAEYANANFFSEDRIWPNDPARSFPYPARSSVLVSNSQIRLRSGEWVTRQYYQKTADGDVGYRLATVGFLRDYFLRYNLDPARADSRPALDEIVYRDYAERLLPRAVGYSVAALDYFFRGQLDARLDGDGLVIVNDTPGEIMAGTFALYFDTSDDERVPLGEWTLTLPPKASSPRLTLPAPPKGKHPRSLDSFHLVFRGSLGAEGNAVAARRLTREPVRGVWQVSVLYNDRMWIDSTYSDAIVSPLAGLAECLLRRLRDLRRGPADPRKSWAHLSSPRRRPGAHGDRAPRGSL
jgi:hypothetical protein